MKILFFLIDGIADVNIHPSLSHQFHENSGNNLKKLSKTPLQAARLPTLDSLAQIGHLGLLDPVKPGLACGSDTAHLSIFGYSPFQ